jgi:hypothetical protein
MRFAYASNYKPLSLQFGIEASRPGQRMRVIVRDALRPNTIYTDRFNTIKGNDKFIIKMPQSPKKAIVYIFSEEIKKRKGKVKRAANGKKIKIRPKISVKRNSKDFKILNKKVMPLETKMDNFDFKNPEIASFVDFAQRFAQQAGYKSPGVYRSDDYRYIIFYNDHIMAQPGKESTTPARISVNNGRIEVSKKYFEKFTVPGRFAILLHEFSHYFANGGNLRDEVEADLHAANIYLALGYPCVELLNVFGNVFLRADTKQNRARFAKMKHYIMNYSDRVLSMKYL